LGADKWVDGRTGYEIKYALFLSAKGKFGEKRGGGNDEGKKNKKSVRTSIETSRNEEKGVGGIRGQRCRDPQSIKLG